MTLTEQLSAAPGLLARALSRWYRGLPERGLAIQELTCLFAVVDPSDPALRNVLERQDAALDEQYEEANESGARAIRSYAVPGLHSFRFTLIAPSHLNIGDEAPAAPSLLLLSMVFDGDEVDVLTGLYETMLPELREVLQYAHGFSGTSTVGQFVSFLLNRRVRSGFFFGDIGLLGEERQHLDVTRSEAEGAVELRSDFVRFYATHRADRPETLRPAFMEWCRTRKVGLPLPLSRFETSIPDEHRWIRRVVELTLRLQERNARQDPEHRKRRVAHTKHHGFMTATFEVEAGLGERYAKGLFAKPGVFNAVVRTSNTSDTRRPDSVRDGRGLSIKVLDVGALDDAAIDPQPEKIVLPCDDVLGVAQSARDRVSQDFMLIANPTFFCQDVRDFTIFRSLVDVTVPHQWLGALALALANPRRALIMSRIIRRRLNHPFEVAYHSMTAYALGEDTAVKYMVQARDPQRFSKFRAPPGTNPLSVTLQESLEHEPIVLDFYIHAPPPEQVDVEDPTADWDRDKYRPVRVATLTIPPQDPATPDRLEQGERTAFNPWNARKEHRPLGSLNRARLAIYRASAESRRGEAQRQAPADPPAAFKVTRPPPPGSEPPPSGENSPSTLPPPMPNHLPTSSIGGLHLTSGVRTPE